MNNILKIFEYMIKWILYLFIYLLDLNILLNNIKLNKIKIKCI